jgi:hypothetical protein
LEPFQWRMKVAEDVAVDWVPTAQASLEEVWATAASGSL